MGFGPGPNSVLNSAGAAGNEYMAKRNKGCRTMYDVWGILFGLVFTILGIIALVSGSFLGALFFGGIGLLCLFWFWKDLNNARNNIPRG